VTIVVNWSSVERNESLGVPREVIAAVNFSSQPNAEGNPNPEGGYVNSDNPSAQHGREVIGQDQLDGV